MQTKFFGYRRDNGRVGIRNHVIILPLDDLSNAACEAVANNIKGTMALPHAYGRLQFGEDLDLHFRTLIGIGCNPNIAAVVVIGIEPVWTNRVVEGIAKLKDELNPEIMRVVFKDAGFADDVVKTNAVQILKQAGIEDVRSL